MKNNNDHIPIVVPITITPIMRRSMLLHSKKLAGCPRPEVGSISWFARIAIIEKLQKCGLDLKKLSEIYQ